MAISERIQENPLYLLFEFQVSDYVVFGLLQREIYSKVIIENWHFLPIFWAHESSFFSPLEISSLVFSSLHARACFPSVIYWFVYLFFLPLSDEVILAIRKHLKWDLYGLIGLGYFLKWIFVFCSLVNTLFHKAYHERNSNIVIISFWNKFDESVIWQGCYGP